MTPGYVIITNEEPQRPNELLNCRLNEGKMELKNHMKDFLQKQMSPQKQRDAVEEYTHSDTMLNYANGNSRKANKKIMEENLGEENFLIFLY